ncbi:MULTISPECIES: hypothetical protein [unclassified Streptomyces]|uniref:hypothetical protein n=1 Tax=unclassified Streptomyces TaxID=2593676 RepID=UPI002DD7E1AD|nr:hypothetical protein [Streptomyces sp. NBC_01788]WSB30652.1 hypothetical protein OIE49_34990 [Streptomyces sp. NBC_01788]
MHEADRTLELCAAAVYLAEAEWRAGDPDAADRAADLALATAGRLGTQHALLGALRAFPGVLSRRLGGLTGADSPWHSLGRPLLAPAAARPRPATAADPLPVAEPSSAVVEFHDLGPVHHYRRFGLALEEVSASPSSATRRLLTELRHA